MAKITRRSFALLWQLFGAAILLGVVNADWPRTCPVGWEYFGGTGKCYQASNSVSSFCVNVDGPSEVATIPAPDQSGFLLFVKGMVGRMLGNFDQRGCCDCTVERVRDNAPDVCDDAGCDSYCAFVGLKARLSRSCAGGLCSCKHLTVGTGDLTHIQETIVAGGDTPSNTHNEDWCTANSPAPLVVCEQPVLCDNNLQELGEYTQNCGGVCGLDAPGCTGAWSSPALSFLNARLHHVKNLAQMTAADVYYAEVSFVSDVEDPTVSDVTVDGLSSCPGSISGESQNVVDQPCGPKTSFTPCQTVTTEKHFVQLYIPLANFPPEGKPVLRISFQISAPTRNVDFEIPANVFQEWCSDSADQYVDSATSALVKPKLLIGTAEREPEMLDLSTSLVDLSTSATLPSGAATKQDALVTVVLEAEEPTPDQPTVEVFIEDLVVLHINPGADDLLDNLVNNAVNQDEFLPTFEYDPETRDATLVLPEGLLDTGACPSAEKKTTPSPFGCVHKHIIKNKEVVLPNDGHLVGTNAHEGAKAWMEALLRGDAAPEAAAQLGRRFEEWLMEDVGVKPSAPHKAAAWVNPAHAWGDGGALTLSQNLIVHVLYGVRHFTTDAQGVATTTETRRLLSSSSSPSSRRLQQTAAPSGSASIVVRNAVDTAEALAAAENLDPALVSAWEAQMVVDVVDACRAPEEFEAVVAAQLMLDLRAHASAIRKIHVLKAAVPGLDCSGTLRRVGGRRSGVAVAEVACVIVMAEGELPFLDATGAEKATGASLVWMRQVGGASIQAALEGRAAGEGAEGGGGGGGLSTAVAIALAAGGGACALLAMASAFRFGRGRREPGEEEEEEGGSRTGLAAGVQGATMERDAFGSRSTTVQSVDGKGSGASVVEAAFLFDRAAPPAPETYYDAAAAVLQGPTTRGRLESRGSRASRQESLGSRAGSRPASVRSVHTVHSERSRSRSRRSSDHSDVTIGDLMAIDAEHIMLSPPITETIHDVEAMHDAE